MSCPFQLGQVVCDKHSPDTKAQVMATYPDINCVVAILQDIRPFGMVMLEMDGLCEDLSHLPEIDHAH